MTAPELPELPLLPELPPTAMPPEVALPVEPVVVEPVDDMVLLLVVLFTEPVLPP